MLLTMRVAVVESEYLEALEHHLLLLAVGQSVERLCEGIL